MDMFSSSLTSRRRATNIILSTKLNARKERGKYSIIINLLWVQILCSQEKMIKNASFEHFNSILVVQVSINNLLKESYFSKT